MELSVLVHGRKFTDAMPIVEDDYRSKSRQLVLQEWLRRPTPEHIFDNLMRLTSSLQRDSSICHRIAYLVRSGDRPTTGRGYLVVAETRA
jgi:hypothetical protein